MSNTYMDYQITHSSGLKYPDGEHFLVYELIEQDVTAIQRELKPFRGIRVRVCYSILENRLFLVIRISYKNIDLSLKIPPLLEKYGIAVNDEDLIHVFHFGVQFCHASAYEMVEKNRLMKILNGTSDILATLTAYEITQFEDITTLLPQIRGLLAQWAEFGGLIYDLHSPLPLLLINTPSSVQIHEPLQNFCAIHANLIKMNQIPLNEKNRTAILGFTYKGTKKAFKNGKNAQKFSEYHKINPQYQILAGFRKRYPDINVSMGVIHIPSQNTVVSLFSKANLKTILEKYYLMMKIVLVFTSQIELHQIQNDPKFSRLKGVEYVLLDEFLAVLQNQ